MTRNLILASTSPYRSELLTRLGLEFTAVAPDFNERIDPGVAPELQVKHLAQGKACSVMSNYPEAVIIGSDQVLCDASGRILGKPGNRENAQRQLERMAGKKHCFYTGLAVLDGRSGKIQIDCIQTTVLMRELSSRQISNYLERERPFDCAGSFKIEGLGIALMQQVGGTDYTALIGLPLIALTRMLANLGLDPLEA